MNFKNKLFIAFSFICITGQVQAMFLVKSQKQNPVVASAFSAIPWYWHYKSSPLQLTHELDQDQKDTQAVIAEQRLRHHLKMNTADRYLVAGKCIMPQVFTLTCNYVFKNSDKQITITSHSEPVGEIKRLNIINKSRGRTKVVPAKRNDILAMIITKNHILKNLSESKGYKTLSSIDTYDGILNINAYLENGETDCIIEHPEEIQLQTNL